MLALFSLLGCPGAPAPSLPPGMADAVVACAPTGDQGLAVRVWWPAGSSARHLSTTPVFVRVGGAGSVGWDIGHDPANAVGQGAAVVQLLRPGDTDGEGVSGGEDGPAFASAVPNAGVVVLTGLSVGGNMALIATAQGGADVDGVVLWESPLVDQLVLEEPTVDGAVDPRFTPGSCTLAGGCPFPGRTDALRWSDGANRLYQDDDGDGFADPDETTWEGARVLRTDAAQFYSRELWAQANESAFAIDTPPSWWPDAAALDAFWAGWDATSALTQIEAGSGLPFFYLARGVDHVQLVHDHVLIGQRALVNASFFRLNADSSYVGTLAGADVAEQDAGVVITDLDALDALPMVDVHAQVLGAELELADRLFLDVWEPDLSAPLLPLSALREP